MAIHNLTQKTKASTGMIFGSRETNSEAKLKFLENKINFDKLMYLIPKTLNIKEFDKFKKIKPKNINDIYKLRDYVSLKLSRLSI